MSTPRMLALTVAATIAFLVATPGPASAATTVALWHMNESSGQMVDSSSFGNNGTLQNVTRVSPGFNGSGRAYSFNGTNSRVIVSNSASLNPGSKNISITAHVRFANEPSASVGDYDLVRKQTSAAAYKMEIMRSGRAFCKFKGNNASLSLEAGPNLANNQRHTIVCRKTSSGITLTVDGAPFSRSGNLGSISNGIALVLGGKTTSGDWYEGLMDEVSIVTG